MSRLALLTGLAATCLVLSTASDAAAQGSRYQPSRPVLSPYLNYFRSDSGPAGRYLTNVAPALQIQREIQQQNANLNTLGTELQRAKAEARMRAQQARDINPTGMGSIFMDYSHFYLQRPQARRRR